MYAVLLFCFSVIFASSDGAVTAKARATDVTAVIEWLHKIHKTHNTRLEVRQGNSACENQLQSSTPSYCNFTELSGGISSLPASSLTDAQLSTLNRAYSQICVSACIDPVETYYNCIQLPDDQKNYLTTAIRQGVCGQESGDYCEVRYIRQYEGDYDRFRQLVNNCTFNSDGISCSSASSACLDNVRLFSTRMGCCTEPYLGSGVTSCSGVSVDNACVGVPSAATGIVAPIFLMVLALLGFFVA